MKILGRVILTGAQSRHLADGHQLVLGREQFRQHAKGKAAVGDLLWVAEPYYEILSKRSCPRTIHHNVRGSSPLMIEVPSYIKPYFELCKLRPQQGDSMRRSDSTVTLEITGFDPHACTVTCITHMLPVDRIMEAAQSAGVPCAG